MIISKFIAQSTQLAYLRLLVLGALVCWQGTSIFCALGDAFVLRGAVGVGRNSKVIGSSKRCEAVLEAEYAGKDDDGGLVSTFGAYFLDEFKIVVLGLISVLSRLTHLNYIFNFNYTWMDQSYFLSKKLNL